ncbi:uncharacterized protein LOC128230453 isoform X1 [Mya arenaria]|uniref:uncharacterized protein LOC128230453 isoform X1 n=1 Tax=Mya arenaria TaxID=6604 RepID=UPI0022E72578|nr:uncharacterized protein LOC128230453 isoform X1 [Mya arenaria]
MASGKHPSDEDTNDQEITQGTESPQSDSSTGHNCSPNTSRRRCPWHWSCNLDPGVAALNLIFQNEDIGIHHYSTVFTSKVLFRIPEWHLGLISSVSWIHQ